MIYTNKTHIVADTLDELHKFAKGLGLTKRGDFTDKINWRTGKSRAYYTIPSPRILDKCLARSPQIISTRQLVVIANNLPGTDMYAGKIQKHLFQHFIKYNYKLCNTHVFAWESDFFCQSDSGYFIEVEVKISRSDFFIDFNKPKHKLFSALRSGKKVLVETFSSASKGDKILSYMQPFVRAQYGYTRKNGNHWKQEYRNGKWGYWVNDYGIIKVGQQMTDVYAPCCQVTYINLEKRNIPNQFYFAVPAGLVKLEEVPAYCGLLTIDHRGVHVLRRAPFLHKRKMDLDKILLQKFYNLWANKQTIEERIELTQQYNEQIKTA